MKRRYVYCVAVMMLAVLCLTACGKDDKKAEETVQTGKIDRESVENAIIMTVGKETVSCDEAKIYLYLLKQQYESTIGEEVWDFNMGNGVDFKTYAKDEILDELTEIKIIVQHGGTMGIALEEEEIQEAKELATDLVSQATPEDRNTFALTEEGVWEVYQDHLLATKVYNITTNEVDTEVSDEEAKQICIQCLQVMTKGTDKNGMDIDMDAEEKVAARQRVQELYEGISEETDFLAYATSNSDSAEIEMTFSKSDMPEDFGEEAFMLVTGQTSHIIEGEEGYYILHCVTDNDEDATIARKEEIIEERQNEAFEQKYAEWVAGYEVIKSTEMWDDVTF